MKKFIILIVIVVGSVWYYGRGLPREHTVKSSIIITSAKVDSVFTLVRRIGNQASWWSDVRSVRPLIGRPRESWEQNMLVGGLVAVEVTSITPPGKMVTTIIPDQESEDDVMKWGGTWRYEVFDSSAGTEVVITEVGWVDPPLYRVYMKMRGEYRTVDSFLTSLAAHFGESATPIHGR